MENSTHKKSLCLPVTCKHFITLITPICTLINKIAYRWNTFSDNNEKFHKVTFNENYFERNILKEKGVFILRFGYLFF